MARHGGMSPNDPKRTSGRPFRTAGLSAYDAAERPERREFVGMIGSATDEASVTYGRRDILPPMPRRKRNRRNIHTAATSHGLEPGADLPWLAWR